MTNNKAQVAIVQAKTYDDARVYEDIKRLVDLLGGINRFVKKGNKVLLKPNLLSAKPPEAGITTHPAVIKAVAKLVMEAGAIPFIGDSPGGRAINFEKVAAVTGMKQAADELGIRLVDFRNSVELSTTNGGIFKKLNVAKEAIDADVIINLPKLKTHVQMFLTLGVKNMFGCIIGLQKAQWHFKAGVDRKYFAAMLLELYSLLKPSLTIVDGIVAMEGDGPGSAGKLRNLGLVFAGSDAVALDTVICNALGVKNEELPILVAAKEKGIGITEMERIDVLGERLKDVSIHDFIRPKMIDVMFGPNLLKKFLMNNITSKPIEDRKMCTLCSKCIEACPTDIISIKNKRLAFDYDKCIRCFCCLEVCPEGAMMVKQGALLKLFSYFS
ncbi:MAG: DUF362 domain-containing protein [Nitrospirota bacterium]